VGVLELQETNVRGQEITMKFSIWCLLLTLLLSPFTTFAQTPSGQLAVPSASTDVPKLVKFSGTAKDESGKLMTGPVGITFSLYKDQQGGSPLWVETQNVQADGAGHYTAMLGSATTEGVPLEVFSSGEAQWLGVQIQGQPAQVRVLLVSVPYALKAHGAETLSGRSISDFVLVNRTASTSQNASNTTASSNSASGSSLPPINNDGPTNFTGNNACSTRCPEAISLTRGRSALVFVGCCRLLGGRSLKRS
jgi:hypothetical protein